SWIERAGKSVNTARACPVATFDAAIDRHVRDHRLPRPDGQAESEQRLEDAVSCLGKQNERGVETGTQLESRTSCVPVSSPRHRFFRIASTVTALRGRRL